MVPCSVTVLSLSNCHAGSWVHPQPHQGRGYCPNADGTASSAQKSARVFIGVKVSQTAPRGHSGVDIRRRASGGALP
jgi:hypothetical protein